MLNAHQRIDDAYLLEEIAPDAGISADNTESYVLGNDVQNGGQSEQPQAPAFLCEYVMSEPAQMSFLERREVRGDGGTRYIRLLGRDEIPELILGDRHWRSKEPSALTSALKRAMDIAGALVALILAAPLFLVVGLRLALQSGPVFFAQTRIGKNGKYFQCYKFRTMHIGAQERLRHVLETDAELRAEWQQHRKLSVDPRITRIGRLLRQTSLDELPQLINVLKGDMSLVGPRPILPNEMQKYRGYIGYYLSVKPALTGLWQINGRNNTTYNRRIALDMTYVRKNSILLDLKILASTLPVLLRGDGAY